MRAGLPTTIERLGTSRVTTAPAPTTAFSPMVIVGSTTAPADHGPFTDRDLPADDAPGPTDTNGANRAWWPMPAPRLIKTKGPKSLEAPRVHPTLIYNPGINRITRGTARRGDQAERLREAETFGFARSLLAIAWSEQRHDKRARLDIVRQRIRRECRDVRREKSCPSVFCTPARTRIPARKRLSSTSTRSRRTGTLNDHSSCQRGQR